MAAVTITLLRIYVVGGLSSVLCLRGKTPRSEALRAANWNAVYLIGEEEVGRGSPRIPLSPGAGSAIPIADRRAQFTPATEKRSLTCTVNKSDLPPASLSTTTANLPYKRKGINYCCPPPPKTNTEKKNPLLMKSAKPQCLLLPASSEHEQLTFN